MPAFLALATLVAGVVLAVPPAVAQTAPPVVVEPRLTGRGPLTVTLVGDHGPVAVTVTDAAGNVAGWTFADEAGSPGALTVDLSAPDRGVEPVNGTATVAVTAGATVLHETQVVFDRDPAIPALGVAVTGRRVDASWPLLTGPGIVTYRLERRAVGGAWDTLAEAPGTTAFTDRHLDPGSYRYRLSAAVPGDDGQPNTASPSVATAVVAPPPPPPERDGSEHPGEEPEAASDDDPAGKDQPPAPPPPPAEQRSGPKGSRKDADPRPRRVAAAGSVTRAVAERVPRTRPPAAHRYADAPALGGLRGHTLRLRPPPRPRVAAILPGEVASGPSVSASTNAPSATAELPAGTPLVITTGGATRGAPPLAVVAAGLLLALLAACHAAVWRGALSRAAADRR